MKTFTIAFVTGRTSDEWPWLRDSLMREFDRYRFGFLPKIIIIQATRTSEHFAKMVDGVNTAPKPNIWQGKHRVTSQDWWAMSNARNTAICLCETEWICFFDDRCVLLPGYLDALQDAMDGSYILAGAYEKREWMTVEDGIIRNGGIIKGRDCRLDYYEQNKLKSPFSCPGSWLFGAIFAMPIEWALEVNGSPEICDGQGFEDVQFGLLLEHNGYPIKYDPRAKIIQDRTPGMCGPTYRREDKGVSPNDKSHALLAMFNKPEVKKAIHTPGWDFDIRKVRADVLAGKPWPLPPNIGYKDWYDQQPIKDFK